MGAAVERWVRPRLGTRGAVTISRPGASGQLSVAWRGGGEPILGRTRAARRRAVFASGRAAWLRLVDGSARSLAILPLRGDDRPIGTLEITGDDGPIARLWEQMEAIADEVGRRMDLLEDRVEHRTMDQVGSLDVSVPGNERLDLGLALTAHEIRGPLLGVRAVLESFLQRADVEPADVQILRRSLLELERLAGTTEQLLGWALSARHLHRVDADVVRVVEEAVDSCRLESGEDRVVLFAPPGLRASIDAPQLRSAVANLVRNALTHADPGTDVEVRVDEQRDSMTLTVRDEGPIIPPVDRARIFDPFVRGSASRRDGRGSGLGLYITRRVVEEHGGTVWVESNEDGTAFHVRLPLRKEGEQRFAS